MRGSSDPPSGDLRTPFPQEAIEGTDYECGYLTVPELHSQPSGQTIQVGVVILKSLEPEPAEPLVMFQGGPGGSSIDFFPNMFASAAYDERTQALLQNSNNEAVQRELANSGVAMARLLRRDRDLIIFDKRGNRYSKPELTCAHDDASSSEPADELTDLQACRDRLTAQGINLAAYNTVESAQDIAALVNALGYEQVNLYGVSYGTTLVQTVMRLYPDLIRSVILDGIVPFQPSLETQGAVILDRLINTVDATCRADPDCNADDPLDNPEQAPDTSCANDDSIAFVIDANTLIKPGTHWLAQSLVGADATLILRRLGLLIFFMLFPVIWLVMWLLWFRKHSERSPRPLSVWANLAVVGGLLLGLLSGLWIVAQVLGLGATVLLGGHGIIGYTQVFVGIDRRFALIYVLPILIALTSVALLVLAMLSWRGKYWDQSRRIYFSIFAGMAMVYTLYLAQAGQLTVFF